MDNSATAPLQRGTLMLTRFRQLHWQEKGASAVEYGLLVAAITTLMFVVLLLFGSTISGVFQTTCDSIKSSSTTGGC